VDEESDSDATVSDDIVGARHVRVPNSRTLRRVRTLPSLLEHQVLVRLRWAGLPAQRTMA
jgi:hypothetical protein